MNLLHKTQNFLFGTPQPQEEYRVNLKEEHLKGDVMMVSDCPGYRAFVDAVKTTTGKSAHRTFLEISWVQVDGRVRLSSKDKFEQMVYISNDGRVRLPSKDKFEQMVYISKIEGEATNMMEVTKEDVGKEIVFHMVKHLKNGLVLFLIH